MIDLNLPEPEKKYCNGCSKTKGLKGVLIHWPRIDYEKPVVKMVSGMEIEPFSMWIYQCQWCRAIETKRKAKKE